MSKASGEKLLFPIHCGCQVVTSEDGFGLVKGSELKCGWWRQEISSGEGQALFRSGSRSEDGGNKRSPFLEVVGSNPTEHASRCALLRAPGAPGANRVPLYQSHELTMTATRSS